MQLQEDTHHLITFAVILVPSCFPWRPRPNNKMATSLLDRWQVRRIRNKTISQQKSNVVLANPLSRETQPFTEHLSLSTT